MQTHSPATIGIFDSGIGGLTVVREIKRLMPGQPIVYFGDTARTPYGTKSPDIIRRYAVQDTQFLIDQGAEIIVIACHSAASTATAVIEERFSLPVFEVVSPSVMQAVKVTRNKRIGIMGTRATVESRVYDCKIPELMPDATVISQACPLLVPLVEEGWLKRRETRMIVKKYLKPLKDRQVDTLVMGCTHYPLLKEIIKAKAGKRITTVDPSYETALAVRQFLEESGRACTDSPADIGNPAENFQAGREDYFVSDIAPATAEIANRFMGRRIKLVKA